MYTKVSLIDSVFSLGFLEFLSVHFMNIGRPENKQFSLQLKWYYTSYTVIDSQSSVLNTVSSVSLSAFEHN